MNATEEQILSTPHTHPPTPCNPALVEAIERLTPNPETVELVRRVLSRGCYQMLPNELPYESAARAVVAHLEAAA